MSDFGSSYMSRNSTTEDTDRHYKANTGSSASGIVEEFFGDLDRSLEILEVGVIQD